MQILSLFEFQNFVFIKTPRQGLSEGIYLERS